MAIKEGQDHPRLPDGRRRACPRSARCRLTSKLSSPTSWRCGCGAFAAGSLPVPMKDILDGISEQAKEAEIPLSGWGKRRSPGDHQAPPAARRRHAGHDRKARTAQGRDFCWHHAAVPPLPIAANGQPQSSPPNRTVPWAVCSSKVEKDAERRCQPVVTSHSRQFDSADIDRTSVATPLSRLPRQLDHQPRRFVADDGVITPIDTRYRASPCGDFTLDLEIFEPVVWQSQRVARIGADHDPVPRFAASRNRPRG